MDYRLALLTGNDIPIECCQLVMHQPNISEIALIGEKTFFSGVQCLCLHKTMFVEDKNVLDDVNNFQIFMMIMQEKEAKEKKDATKQVLSLLFPDYKILFTPNSLLFQKEENSIIIDISNFEELQDVFRLVFCMKNATMDQVAFNPQGEKAKEIAKKLMRGRERIAAEANHNNTSIFSQYLSILSVGLHQTFSTLVKLTMYQLYDLIERYMLWSSWDQDVKIRLAGGKPDNKPDNWMKNIH